MDLVNPHDDGPIMRHGWPKPLRWEVVERRGRFYIKLDGKYQRDALWRKVMFTDRATASHLARIWAHAETADDLRREIRAQLNAGHEVNRVLWERLRYLEAQEAQQERER